MEALLVIWLIAIVLATIIGANKGRAGAGFLLGTLLGLIGVIIIACMRPDPTYGRYPCPECAEAIMPAAKVCPNCRAVLA